MDDRSWTCAKRRLRHQARNPAGQRYEDEFRRPKAGQNPNGNGQSWLPLRCGNCSGVGQTSVLPVHGVSDSVFLLASRRRARGPANWQTGGPMPLGIEPMPFGIIRESQRDSAPKPRVASRELPWEKRVVSANPNGVVARWRSGGTTPLGLKIARTLTQGSLADSATLGWRTQSLWDCRRPKSEGRRPKEARSALGFRPADFRL